MPSIISMLPTTKKVLPVFFVVDVAIKAFSDNIINNIDLVMEEMLLQLKKIGSSTDVDIKVDIMIFDSDSSQWITETGPVSITDFQYSTVVKRIVDQQVDVRAALIELDKRLSGAVLREIITTATDMYMPIIAFVTDGNIIDNSENELNTLYSNRWYINATKVGILTEVKDNVDALSLLIGGKDTIIDSHELDCFGQIVSTSCFGKKKEPQQMFFGEGLTVELDDITLCEIRKEEEYSICKCQIVRCEPNEALNTVIKITSKGCESGSVKVSHEFSESVVLVRNHEQYYSLESADFPSDLKLKGSALIEIADDKLCIKPKNELEIKETMIRSKEYILGHGDYMILQYGTVHFIDNCLLW